MPKLDLTTADYIHYLYNLFTEKADLPSESAWELITDLIDVERETQYIETLKKEKQKENE
jgi:hypothetical protein